MSTPSAVFTQMVTTTLRHIKKTLTDNVSDKNMLLYKMKRKKGIKTFKGGYEIQIPMDYAENGTFGRHAAFEEMDVSASDTFTSSVWLPRQSYINIVSSGEELRKSSGDEQIIDLVKAKVENAKRTAANNMSRDIYSDGALSNQIGGLAHIIQTNGQGTVGGINSATFAFHRNQFREATGTNTAASPTVANSQQFFYDMGQLWLATERGTEKPDCIPMTYDFYSLFELALQANQRYSDADMAALGFTTLKYKTADVFADNNTNFGATGERAYFLNTEFLKLYEHEDARWTLDEERRPTNQDGVVLPMIWMGQMVCTQRARQGVLFDAA